VPPSPPGLLSVPPAPPTSRSEAPPPPAATTNAVTGTFNGIDVPPQSTAAVLCNLTVVTPSGVGYLVMLKPGAGYAGTSNVDFTAGQIISSSVSCGVYGYPWALNSWVWVGCGGGPTNLIVDVFGYYE